MSFYRESAIKKCRKRHLCQWCPQPIEKGASAMNCVGKGEDFYNVYFHPECAKVTGSYSDYDPHWEDFEPHEQKRGIEYTED